MAPVPLIRRAIENDQSNKEMARVAKYGAWTFAAPHQGLSQPSVQISATSAGRQADDSQPAVVASRPHLSSAEYQQLRAKELQRVSRGTNRDNAIDVDSIQQQGHDLSSQAQPATLDAYTIQLQPHIVLGQIVFAPYSMKWVFLEGSKSGIPSMFNFNTGILTVPQGQVPEHVRMREIVIPPDHMVRIHHGDGSYTDKLVAWWEAEEMGVEPPHPNGVHFHVPGTRVRAPVMAQRDAAVNVNREKGIPPPNPDSINARTSQVQARAPVPMQHSAPMSTPSSRPREKEIGMEPPRPDGVHFHIPSTPAPAMMLAQHDAVLEVYKEMGIPLPNLTGVNVRNSDTQAGAPLLMQQSDSTRMPAIPPRERLEYIVDPSKIKIIIEAFGKPQPPITGWEYLLGLKGMDRVLGSVAATIKTTGDVFMLSSCGEGVMKSRDERVKALVEDQEADEAPKSCEEMKKKIREERGQSTPSVLVNQPSNSTSEEYVVDPSKVEVQWGTYKPQRLTGERFLKQMAQGKNVTQAFADLRARVKATGEVFRLSSPVRGVLKSQVEAVRALVEEGESLVEG